MPALFFFLPLFSHIIVTDPLAEAFIKPVSNNYFLGSEVSISVNIRIVMFGFIRLCSLVGGYRCFRACIFKVEIVTFNL
jgi:hypothetical protein